MRKRHAGCVALVGLLLSACAGNPQTGTGPHENTGTVVGAVGGAIVGSQFGRGSGRVASTVAGAAIGGLIGNRIGAALDDEDRTRAYEAQITALESGTSGTPVGWRNEDSGRHGTVVPGPYYPRNAMTCRQYTHTVFVEEGKPQVTRGTACRNPDGTWVAVT
jgi:surface antigen